MPLKSNNIKLADENVQSDTVGPIPLIIGAEIDQVKKFVIVLKFYLKVLL